jgi:hypothetical protein
MVPDGSGQADQALTTKYRLLVDNLRSQVTVLETENLKLKQQLAAVNQPSGAH